MKYLLQNRYYLNAFVVYLEATNKGRDERGKARYYVTFKYLNSTWFTFNDDVTYTCGFPTYPLNVYMAFYRPEKNIGCQIIRNLNMANVCEITDYQVTLMFRRPHKATRTKTGKVFTTNPTKVAINEGKFVPSKDNQAFIAKAALRPALLTKKSTYI